MQITRRQVLKHFGSGIACLAVSDFVGLSVAFGQGGAEILDREFDYRSWEDLFRKKWTWDKIAYATHSVGCSAQCQWCIYVKDGVAFKEEQVEHPRSPNPETPDPGPQGCQRGACFTNHMYGPDRIKYPLKRVGKRGDGKWKRISWDEALTEAADAIIDACVQDGPRSIVNDYGDETEYAWRNFYKQLGNIQMDSPVSNGDHHMGNYQTFGNFGLPTVNRRGPDFFKSDLIFIWHWNPIYTQIPYYKLFSQARYMGAEIVTVAPDLSPSTVHADYWIPVEPGNDVAFALSMCKVIVDEKLYKPEFLKEQTDLPLLVRQDTKKYLRSSDLRSGGSEEQFYLYDSQSRQVVEARRDTLELSSVDPALEGTYEVSLSNGRKVQVRPVFEHLKESLNSYTPEAAAEIISKPFAKVHPDVIRQLARKAGKAKQMTITYGNNMSKCYHLDLHNRGIALFLVLSGHANRGGQVGGGFGGGFWSANGPKSTLWEIPRFMEEPGVEGGIKAFRSMRAEVEETLARDSTMTAALGFRQHERDKKRNHYIVPGWQWMYYRVGFKDILNDRANHDPSYRDFKSYVDEANRKGWWDGFIGPDQERAPVRDRVFLSVGGNHMRRLTGSSVINDQYTPGLQKIIKVDFRMSATTLHADLVLPVCGYYEKIHVRRSTLWLMDQAVKPLGESRSDYSIACLLAKYLSKRAKERGIGEIQDTRQGTTLDLANFYDKYTVKGAYGEDDEAKLADTMFRIAAEIGYLAKGSNLETVRKNRGFPVRPDSVPPQPGENRMATREYVPHPTLSRRMQFYLDHDWFLEAGEGLPVHKPHPLLGGDHPFHQTGGHGRESIHSIWIANPLLLRLTRGVPSLFVNKEVGQELGIEDYEEVEVYNDAGSYRVRVKLSSLMRPNQVAIYHCWEPFQFSKGHYQAVNVGTAKPLLLGGGYGHMQYLQHNYQPSSARRGARVNIRKLSA